MKLITRLTTVAVARLGQALRSVQAMLRASMPPPVLVPIPIRSGRRTSDVDYRQSRRRY